MAYETAKEAWRRLEEKVAADDREQLWACLDALTPAETALAVSRLSDENRKKLLAMLSPQDAAVVIDNVTDTQAVGLIEELPPAQAAAIIGELNSDNQADILGELSSNHADAILEEMPFSNAESIRQLLSFPPDTAGGIMMTEFLVYADQLRVMDVLDDLREHSEVYSDYAIQYAYITNQKGKLSGVLPMRELLFAKKTQMVADLMIANPRRVPVHMTLGQLREFFDEHRFLGVPVVNAEGCVIGVVRRSAVEQAIAKNVSKMFLRFSGIVGGEEFRSMPLAPRSMRRLSWLSINIVLNIIAASVIACYEDTLAQVIALAVFLPIISDMSGCSGNQSVAVSMRELTLGLIKPREFLRVLLKECPLGILNGVVLGALIGLVALVWKGNPYLGLVVGAAMAANTLVSVCLGGLIPLALRNLKLDPALVSGPILTTVTDMCGFFFVLSLASMMLPLLA